MDGNNRWSKKNNVSKFEAYKTGSQNLLKISEYLFNNYELQYISAFGLSSNNLNRNIKLIQTLKKVFNYFLEKIIDNEQKNYSIKIIGDLSFLDEKVIKKTNDFIKKQKNLPKKLILFINYSGQKDIENACKLKSGTKVSHSSIANFLSTRDLPNPDLLFRSGGFQRISNFMLYEIAFTELYFSKKLWPEINNLDLKRAINKYYKIERKFGF